MPGIIVDGMDVITVYNYAQEAVKRARAGEGPTLIECKTYRFRGHFEGDPRTGGMYRSETEMDEWRKKCPINTFRMRLIEKGVFEESEMEEIKKQCVLEIEEAVVFAKNSQYPSATEVTNNVFSSNRQCEVEE